jgi:hypothetical protein
MDVRFRPESISANTAAVMLAGWMLLAATPAAGQGNDAEVIACQHYEGITRAQRFIAVPVTENGTGRGCPGAVGDRWKSDTAFHFRWCMGATQAERDSETRARRALLMDCNAKRRTLTWPSWDRESCHTFSPGWQCGQSPNADGKAKCDALGKQVIEGVEKVRKDLSMLFDPDKDPGLDNSRLYYHFGHWTDFSCEIKPSVAGTRVYALIGYTGPRAIGRKKYIDRMAAPGPIKTDRLKNKNIDLYKK